MIFRRILQVCLLLLSIGPAQSQIALPFPGPSGVSLAPIGTPVKLANHSSTAASVNTLTQTTTQNILSGDTVGVLCEIGPASTPRTVTSVTDGTNTYVQASGTGSPAAKCNTANTNCIEVWLSFNSSAVASGATLTCNWSGVSQATRLTSMMSFRVSGLKASPVDQSGNAATSSTTPTVTLGALAQANEIVIGATSNANSETLNSAVGFANIDSVPNSDGGSAGYFTSLDYQIVSATTAPSYPPVWSGSQPKNSVAVSLKGN